MQPMTQPRDPSRTHVKGAFQKGKSPNPGGREALPPELRKALALSSRILRSTISEYLYLSPKKLKTIAHSDSEPSHKVVIAAFILATIKRQDPRLFNSLLDRSNVGPIALTMDVDITHRHIETLEQWVTRRDHKEGIEHSPSQALIAESIATSKRLESDDAEIVEPK